MLPPRAASALSMLTLLGACATLPGGPSLLALPGTGKSFDQFRLDERYCREYARDQIGKSPSQAAAESGVRSAAIGTALGAAGGALIDGSHGAGVGAGAGLLIGALVGTDTAASSGYEAQRRYDYGYLQCMYANGHRVPVSGEFSPRTQSLVSQPRAAATLPPPPPPGMPPPPPPDLAPPPSLTAPTPQ
jgi:YMGG-like Gly-zipper